jgi:Glycosyl hydrolases family 16
VSDGSWSGSPSSFGYQWQDCASDGTGCSNISGATSSTYTVGSEDAGHTIEAVVTATNAGGSTSAAAPIVPLIDNFTADSAIDTNVWDEIGQQGDTSNSEIECYLPSQLSVNATSGLQETLQYVSAGITCPAGTPLSTNPLNWESGAVQMKSVNFTYGTVVVRAKMAGGDGAWPAIWLLGAQCQQPTWLTAGPGNTGYDCQWPNDTDDAAEIDVAEDLGSNGTPDVYENVYSNSTNHSCTYNTGSDLSTTYHDYELDWTPGSIVFKVDGTTTSCGITGNNVPSHPMFLIVNTAACTTGSSCGHGTNTATFPQTTSIAWAHISH